MVLPFKAVTFLYTPAMPESGYAEVHCLCFDALLLGQGEENSTVLTRLHLFNGSNYEFEPEGTTGLLTARIAAYDKNIESPSPTFSEDEYHSMGDANSSWHEFVPIKDMDVNPGKHCARFTMSGTVDTIHQDPDNSSFTLNIPQYLSMTGKDSRPVLPLKCVLPKSKKWKDPASLLPFPRSIVSCAGVLSHYEKESRNGQTFARLVVIVDVIEYLAKPPTERTATSTPQKTGSNNLLAKSRYGKKATNMCSPSPVALGKQQKHDDDDGDHSDELLSKCRSTAP
ncbi:hypothetical protein BC835DRAFT_1412472 [Cytidiella melzeri]|nr:hypothetical protein BC835DRAFT_1412472 [Cytidiella melzeri]